MTSQQDALRLSAARRACVDGRARAVREAANLSLADVASVCRCSSAAVSRWESGTRVPRGEAGVRYGRLLARLGLDVAPVPAAAP